MCALILSVHENVLSVHMEFNCFFNVFILFLLDLKMDIQSEIYSQIK